MTQQRSRRHAPLARVALLSLLLAALAALAGGAHAAPARQPDSTPQPTAPAPGATSTTEPTAPGAAPTTQPAATAPSVAPTTQPASPPPSATPTTQPAAPSAPPAIMASAAPAAPPEAATGSPVAAPAQTVSLDISKTLIGSDVVQVGQYLTFTIRITNTGSTAVTDLPLVDEFETSILQPAATGTSPPPTSSASGVLRWADLTDTFGDLAPGASVSVTVVFRAIRIDDVVINRARVETGLGSGGGGGAPFEDEADGKVEGGQVIVEKALVESFINLDTPVISFTVSLRNDGFTDIVTAPVVDTYRTDMLSFISASVPPDVHNPATGELRWNNVLAGLGVTRLRPQEKVSFTAAYRITGPIDDVLVNSADAVEVKDEFGNQVASPRRAEVRIKIAGPGAEATATATSTPEEERRSRHTPTATATAEGALTATPDSALTATPDSALTATTEAAHTTTTPEAGLTATSGTATTGAAGGTTEARPATLPATGAAAPAALPATGAAAPALPSAAGIAGALWVLCGLAICAIAVGLIVRRASGQRGR